MVACRKQVNNRPGICTYFGVLLMFAFGRAFICLDISEILVLQSQLNILSPLNHFSKLVLTKNTYLA